MPRTAPDFTINIRSKSGDRAQLTVTRAAGRLLTADGFRSARQIGRAIEMLLREATP